MEEGTRDANTWLRFLDRITSFKDAETLWQWQGIAERTAKRLTAQFFEDSKKAFRDWVVVELDKKSQRSLYRWTKTEGPPTADVIIRGQAVIGDPVTKIGFIGRAMGAGLGFGTDLSSRRAT